MKTTDIARRLCASAAVAALIISGSLSTITAAFAAPTARDMSDSSPQFANFAPDGMGFSVQMPPVTKSAGPISTEIGGQSFYLSSNSNSFYEIGVMKLNGTTDNLDASSQDQVMTAYAKVTSEAILNGAQGITVVFAQNTTVSGCPAKQYTIQAQGNVAGQMVVCMTSDRLLEFMAIATNPSDVSTFFNSITIQSSSERGAKHALKGKVTDKSFGKHPTDAATWLKKKSK